AVGYAEANGIYSAFPTKFMTTTVDKTAILFRYTLSGNGNLDHLVDLTDFTFLAANFNGTGKSWVQGDYNYDGSVDLTDFTFLASNFNRTLPADGGASGLGSLVPEPVSLGVLAMLGSGLMLRRRRSR